MNKIIFSLLFISSIAFSQTNNNIGDFNKITTFDQIELVLIPSNENKILLDGDLSEQVELINKNGELKIRLPLTQLLKGDNITATVYFKNLTALEANEGSRISCEKTVKSLNFDIIAKEGSEINLKLETTNLNVRCSQGSSISIDGNSVNQDITINSGAMYFGSTMLTKKTNVIVNAGGDADVYATEYVNAKVRAGGLITIFGKPKLIDQQTVAGGTIEEAPEIVFRN